MVRSNVTKLSPLRRGYVMGYRRARHKARVAAARWKVELEVLEHDYRELALALHRDHYDRALDAAIVQRATLADIVLH
jgi:hypothetical protein